MGKVTVDQVIADISLHLHLSKEDESDVLEEIRTHLEDAAADRPAQGEGDEQAAVLVAAEQFGVEEACAELQEVHASWEANDVILGIVLPVLFAIILRWLAFAPDGSALDWPLLLVRPGFYFVAILALVIPIVCFYRRRFALVGWGVFWLLTVIFVLFPSIKQW